MDFRFNSLHHLRYDILRPHMAARLTMPSGTQYAFDPTAAHSGWKEYWAPWDEYARRRIHRIDENVPLEHISDTQVPVVESALRSDTDPEVDRARDASAAKLVKVLRARKGGLRAILKLSVKPVTMLYTKRYTRRYGSASRYQENLLVDYVVPFLWSGNGNGSACCSP